ncbi:MAG TPA: hypothetical protein VNN19_01395 [bacterium]|nr:hypothetical protein [bacterium]
MLVRVRTTPVDQLRFVREANESARAAMSAVELARSDAQMLNDNLMALFVPSESSEIATASDRESIRAFATP